jgi:hypothetical protein
MELRWLEARLRSQGAANATMFEAGASRREACASGTDLPFLDSPLMRLRRKHHLPETDARAALACEARRITRRFPTG